MHPINAISNTVEFDMTRYWTPSRAAYFDHVPKTGIVDIVANAVSPKAAADLSSMKKADAVAAAAAAAELRLANAHWLPEVLTHCDVPLINNNDAGDEDNGADTQDGKESEINGEPNDELNGEPSRANRSDADMHYHDASDAAQDER